MKKIAVLIVAFVAMLGFNACEEENTIEFTAQPDPEGISFVNAVSSEYILTNETASNIAERFVWEASDFGISTPVTYTLEGAPTTSFEDITTIGSTKEKNLAVTVAQLIGLAQKAGLDNDPNTSVLDADGNPVLDADGNPVPNDSGEVYLRLSASIGTQGGEAIFSEVSPIKVTLLEPTEEETELPKFYVIGSFLEASGYGPNWTNSEALPFISSAGIGETEYEGFINMQGDGVQFKFLPEETGTMNFMNDYGDAGDTDGSYTQMLKLEGEVNCGTPDGPGYYWIKADINEDAPTYELTKTDWGVIGNATPTGWDSDTDLVYNPDTRVWTVTLNLTKQDAPDNGLKFRANDAWDIDFGDSGADGSLDFKGTNISVPEDGTYLITLDFSNPRAYTYSLEKQ